VAILRNMEGLDDKQIGYGNEKAINQLLAHHGIVFKPEERKVWVSSNPYQMGEFVAYDLDEAFKIFENGLVDHSVAMVEENIPKSEFIQSKAFHDYEEFRKLEAEVKTQLSNKFAVPVDSAERLVKLNPHFWEAWFLAGKIYYDNAEYKNAVIHFKQAKRKEVTTLPDVGMIEKMIKKSYRRL
ncbi:MAG: acyl-CoA--6-aminopenicillanic acid acyl-transferase, partial [Gramella sp.]|nr:acyl-CoA--6-aminopenicillanic acid acyl-transferase [Christiangramia sp.]